MGMNVGSNQDDDVMLDVNMTPLIDVMLVLLIMFIITIPLPNNSININLPNGTPPPTEEKPPEIVNLRLDAQGQILWNDQPVANAQALEALFKTVAQKADQDQIKIKADRATEYKHIAMVMAAAQRLEVKKIGIVSNNNS
ncbi:biopolymer transporter ExbD [Acinetobacter variabilis]|uniref:ExbD/TolR family protein n=1 Tax=Acinetobacter variabilis TaxID=70346 RepID=UPI003B841CDD